MYLIKGRERNDAEIAAVQSAIDRVVAEKREAGTTLNAATITQMTEALFDARENSSNAIKALLDRVIVASDEVELDVPGAGDIAFRLGAAPSADVVVSIASSSSDLVLSNAGNKTFTTTNWNTNQSFSFGGATEGDFTITLTASDAGGYVGVKKEIRLRLF